MSEFPINLGDEGPMIRFAKVTKMYGEITALDEISFDIFKHEIVSIIGPSGSGKSAVLRLLMALEEVSAGVIYIEGEPLTHMPKNGRLVPASKNYLKRQRTKVGMCFQHFNLFPHLTALENCMEGPVYVLKLSKQEARERAWDLLDTVGLSHRAHQHPDQLSGGQQQRVAIARALAMRPQVLLLDEFTSALDLESIDKVLNVIRQIKEDHHLTVLIVTHRLGFAREISDHVLVFHDAKIIEQGPPSEIFFSPRDERTRQFLRMAYHAR